MIKILFNKAIPVTLWDNFIAKNTFASPFQTRDFFNFFNSIEGYSADAFAVEELGSLVALIVVTLQKEDGIKAFFSRRGIVYGGPLLIKENTDSFFVLLKYIQEYYKKKVIYLEIRNFFNYSEIKHLYAELDWIYEPWLNYQVNTCNKTEMESAISESRARQIRKAIKNGVYWKEAEKIEDVKRFYSILASLYKQKVKKPLMKWEFFRYFFEMNMGKYFIVCLEEKVIGGIMCPELPGKAVYEFYVCGLDREYKEQYPSVIATWAALDYANNAGIPLFDFMGAGNPEEEYGVREFKKRFGGKSVEFGRFVKILNPFFYKIGKMGVFLLSNIK